MPRLPPVTMRTLVTARFYRGQRRNGGDGGNGITRKNEEPETRTEKTGRGPVVPSIRCSVAPLLRMKPFPPCAQLTSYSEQDAATILPDSTRNAGADADGSLGSAVLLGSIEPTSSS